MKHSQRGLVVFVLVSMGLAVSLSAAAADIVAVQAGPAQVVFSPLVAFEHGTLTVSAPDGTVSRQEFGAGEKAVYSPFAQGVRALDGPYNWEVWLGRPSLVSANARAAALAARKSGDVNAEQAHRSASAGSTAVQSGTFSVVNGSILPTDLVEPRGTSGGTRQRSSIPDEMRLADFVPGNPYVQPVDQVIPDDLIVQQSLCVGFDCVNNENFGFDTIRLKENNLRIKFEDTSVGSFPTNDWQLTANDSASGGASRFSIEDITGSKVPFTITAGATTNSIFVDSTGRVGFRTSTPVLDLHVNTSNTPALRMEQNNSGGFTAQTWDIGANEANFFVRDVTGGSKLSFRIRPGAPTSSIDISADGDVGIGTASPDEKLHVLETSNTSTISLVENTNTGVDTAAVSRVKSDTATASFQAHAAARTVNRFGTAIGGFAELINNTGNGFIVGTTNNTALILGANSTSRLAIQGGGAVRLTTAGFSNCTGLSTNVSGDIQCIASSGEFKHVTGDLPAHVALANIMALKPQMGSYKVSPELTEHWLIAEQAASVDAALVGFQDGKPHSIKTQNVVADLIAVVQQQQRWIEEQRRLIELQQQRLDALERATR